MSNFLVNMYIRKMGLIFIYSHLILSQSPKLISAQNGLCISALLPGVFGALRQLHSISESLRVNPRKIPKAASPLRKPLGIIGGQSGRRDSEPLENLELKGDHVLALYSVGL